jgi:hypothetical protein
VASQKITSMTTLMQRFTFLRDIYWCCFHKMAHFTLDPVTPKRPVCRSRAFPLKNLPDSYKPYHWMVCLALSNFIAKWHVWTLQVLSLKGLSPTAGPYQIRWRRSSSLSWSWLWGWGHVSWLAGSSAPPVAIGDALQTTAATGGCICRVPQEERS